MSLRAKVSREEDKPLSRQPGCQVCALRHGQGRATDSSGQGTDPRENPNFEELELISRAARRVRKP